MKGFYFSFDAMMALMVMTAVLAFVSQYSALESGEFDTKASEFRENIQAGQDSLRMSSATEVETFENWYTQDLVSETVLTSDDMERPVLEAITYLWASGNRDYAANMTERYFGPKLGNRSYRMVVMEAGDTYTVFSKGNPGDESSISTTRTLVSGFKLNETSVGYRARAKVLGARSNVTDVYPISPAGTLVSGGGRGQDPNTFEVNKSFDVGTYFQLQEAELDLVVEEGPSSQFRTLYVNGEEVDWSDNTEIYTQDDVSYYRMDITAQLEEGRNTVYIRLEDPRGGSQTQLYPGSRVKARYMKDPETVGSSLQRKNIEFKQVDTNVRGGDSGLFTVEEFSIPEGSEVVNASMSLDIEGFEAECGSTGWDLQASMNGDNIVETCESGSYSRTLNITNSTTPGQNLVSIYANHNGEDAFWGGDFTRLLSSPGDAGSQITVWYRRDDRIDYGSYRARTAEEIGPPDGNPRTYNATFNYSNVSSTSLYLSQAYSEEPLIEVKPPGQTYSTVFNASETGVTPTLISVDPAEFNLSSWNEVRFSDSGGQAEFLRYTLFEYTVWAPSSVGYGDVFATQEKARQDAEKRLENRLGDLIEAEEIDPSSVSIGGQKELWGPSVVELVIANE